ncbi:glucosyltransferase domain-containing protein [Sporosarcina sp. FSL K6-1522]|uniref:glucosyltransferase domain-containing protein n=1 Tax=Sporosarcina sp. FSL K6-1522 TaxID=2921554 RepID=UPI00315B2F6E
MLDKLIKQLKGYIQPEWRLAFISTFIIGLLTHFYVFINRLPNHDGMYNIYSSQAKVTSGRFFLGPASGLSSYFDLPWINGIFSVFFLALTAVCIVALFKLKQKVPIILVSGIIVTFPSVSSTFAYMFTADGYMVGTFLTILGILLTKRYKYGFVAGAITLMLGVGIYQANISVALGFITLYLISTILFEENDGKQIWNYIVRFALMTGIGMGLYLVVYKFYTNLFQGEITSYQGLDKVGKISISDIPHRYQDIKASIKEFFFHSIYAYDQYNFHEMLNIAIISLIVVATITWIVTKKVYKKPGQLLVLALLGVTLPFSYYIVYFISLEAEYHMLMVFSLTTVYIYLAIMADKIDVGEVMRWDYLSGLLTTILLGAMIVNFAIIANIAYMNMELRYEKSMHLANRVLERIERLEVYDEVEKIGVVGRAPLYTKLTSETIPRQIPRMVGTTGETFLAESEHYQKAFENFFGYSIRSASPDEVAQIKELEAFKEMPIWPSEKSIQVFDGIVIVKFVE